MGLGAVARWFAENRASFMKGQLTMQPKSRHYQDATWSWLRKNIKPQHLKIRVSVWDPQGEPAHKALGQDFTPDSLSAAKKYAKMLVDQGMASMTYVAAQVYVPYKERSLPAWSFGRYERGNPMGRNSTNSLGISVYKKAAPARGWRKAAPKRKSVRQRMADRCGPRKCFLEPKTLSFPICKAKGPKGKRRISCKPDCRGLLAAFNRAKQYGRRPDIACKAIRKASRMGCSWTKTGEAAQRAKKVC